MREDPATVLRRAYHPLDRRWKGKGQSSDRKDPLAELLMVVLTDLPFTLTTERRLQSTQTSLCNLIELLKQLVSVLEVELADQET